MPLFPGIHSYRKPQKTTLFTLETNTYLQAEEETHRYYRDVYHLYLPNTNITRKCRPAPSNQQVGRLYETQEKPTPPPLKGSGRKATDLPPRMRLDRMCPDPTYSQPSHADSNSPIAHRSPRNHSSGAIFIMKISLGNKVQTYTWTIHPDSMLFLHRSAPYLFTNKYF